MMAPPKKQPATVNASRSGSPKFAKESKGLVRSQDPISVLVVCTSAADRACLRQIFSSRTDWKICEACSYRDAVLSLSKHQTPVVISECCLPDGNWKDLLSRTAVLINPPQLIVTSNLADDRLWAEVLNLGGYDVLAKPFDPEEVVRVVSLAWGQWKIQWERTHQEGKTFKAAV